MNEKKFLKSFFLFLPLFILAAASFNAVVDPYGLFNLVSMDHFNSIKPKLGTRQRLLKVLGVERLKPETLILGSSRVMIGFNPDDLPESYREKAYNCAFAGSNFLELYAYFEHALQEQPHLKCVILGIDIYAFGENCHSQADLPLEMLNGQFPIKETFQALFTTNSLKSSLSTIKHNVFNPDFIWVLPNGMSNPDPKVNSKFEILEAGELNWLKLWINYSETYGNYKLSEERINLLKKMVTTCKENSIELYLFINPTQAKYWEAIYHKGLWKDFEHLKKVICEIHPLWDFSGYNCVTTQEMDKVLGPLYYECSHYRPSLGTLMIHRMFNYPEAIKDFGYYLTPETIEAVFKDILHEREKWVSDNPELYTEIHAIPIEQNKVCAI